MSGETKKRMKSVVCAGIVTLALAGMEEAKANLVDSMLRYGGTHILLLRLLFEILFCSHWKPKNSRPLGI